MAYSVGCTACQEVEELLFLLADGELDENTQERLQAHLDGCGQCKTLLDVEMHLRQLIKHCFERPVPADLEAKIRSQLAELQIGRL
ncbi:mycothiol system anti-sigma-R factor [Gleimia coleocanis DSM 15436]|uniref:Mycothiol system anti-sigma-R factor n=1 Tax=Gleimia coleocanis DSM 15436 TaxID=525245 RepID=C0VZX7_9ACTO|nr:mycothiol system anti-sigma-R factor [Gleimia coleocanis]EEH63836.1 mycothiol system anti-sigma-R factor [Gleimia coleocanis DSM 15436]